MTPHITNRNVAGRYSTPAPASKLTATHARNHIGRVLQANCTAIFGPEGVLLVHQASYYDLTNANLQHLEDDYTLADLQRLLRELGRWGFGFVIQCRRPSSELTTAATTHGLLRSPRACTL